MKPPQRRFGFTLIEIMVVVAIFAVLAAVTTIRMGEWLANQRVKAAARSAADALLLARSEAIRSGGNYIVFVGGPGATDPAGTLLEDSSGSWVPLLILNDGPSDTANCQIDNGEETRAIQPERDVHWGVSHATSAVPDDGGRAPFVPPQASGTTFADPSNNPVNWVLFRSDGIPVAFSFAAGTCGEIGRTGSGAAALYLTNGKRDYAVVLSPLGGVRIHLWDSGGWQG